MQTVTSTQAKNQFWEILDTVIREPVVITRRGRKIAYMLSEQDFQDFLDGSMAKKIDEKEEYLSIEESHSFLSSFEE